MKKRLRKIRRKLIGAAFMLIAGSAALVLPLRWINPPISSFMLIRQIDAWQNQERRFRLDYHWRYWNQIAPELLLALIAAEDQKFPTHSGFDLDSIHLAFRNWQNTGRLRGASTISQQVAKNLYLWGGRNFLRKALEAYFTVLLELLLEKKRILEIYANIAEFGDGVYGAQAASQRFFGKPARQLNSYQASLLAAVLPNPRLYRVDRPSGYVEQKSQWIRMQITQLGGILYLQSIQ